MARRPPGPPPGRPWRVVVDTNAWLSAFLNPDSQVGRRLLRLRLSSRFLLVFSRELQDEIVRVLTTKSYFTARISAVNLGRIRRRVARFAPVVAVQSVVSVCRDPHDNFLLALCQDAAADFLISGDKDLLVLGSFGPTRILPWAEAASLFGLDNR